MTYSTVYRLVVALLLTGAGLRPAVAQDLTLFVESDTLATDDDVAVNVWGVGVNDVAGLQFSLRWDTLVLEYTGVSQLALNATDDSFNRSQLDSGRIGYLVFASDIIAGFDAPDSLVLFTLNFTSRTEVTTRTEIGFSSMPTSKFFTRGDRSTPSDTLLSGTILLEGSSRLPAYAQDDRLRVHPNPITDQSRIELRLGYSSPAILEVIDVRGRTVSRRTVSVGPGLREYALTGRDFPAAGTYVVRLSTDREQFTRKVVRQ